MNLIPDEADELLQRIDQPLTEKADPDTVKFRNCLNAAYLRGRTHDYHPM